MNETGASSRVTVRRSVPFTGQPPPRQLSVTVAPRGASRTTSARSRVREPSSAHWLVIAAATGINRETARRKVNKLIAAGLLERAEGGSIRFSPGFSQRQEPSAMTRAQLDALVRIANELMRDGVLTMSSQAMR